ncbi:MAG: hypothetical protein DRO13_00630 [Thermoprotei archaeon]|nr:MAG: hypothetical protein DRO13_00630 [Thermoprotei archaeon]
MASVVREYSSFTELIDAIDRSINILKQQLTDFLKRLEDARARTERERKLKELIKRLTGEEDVVIGKLVDLKEIKLFINPDAEQESKLLEEVIDKINKNIQTLQNIKRALEPFAKTDIEIRIFAIYRDGVPEAIIIRL